MFWFNAIGRWINRRTKTKPSPPEPIIKFTLDSGSWSEVTRQADSVCFHISGTGQPKYLEIRIFGQVVWTGSFGPPPGRNSREQR